MIDSVVFSPPGFTQAARQMLAEFAGAGYLAAARTHAIWLYLNHVDIDDPQRKERLLAPIHEANLKIPQHAAISAFTNFLDGYDVVFAARACKAPMLYIDAGVPMIEKGRDLARLRAACPQLMVAKTYGSGHFSPLEVPDQINAMIARFIAVGIGRRRS